MKTKKLTTIAVLCAMALIVNLLIRFPLVPSAMYLEYSPTDVFIIIAGFIYGPTSAIISSCIVAFLEILYRGGNIVNFIMDIISTCALACTAGYIYKKMHTKNGAFIALTSGTLIMVIAMAIWNYVFYPIYYSMDRNVVVTMLPAISLFNLLKGGLNSALTLFLYKPLVTLFRRTHFVESQSTSKLTLSGMSIIGLFIIITIAIVVLTMQGIL